MNKMPVAIFALLTLTPFLSVSAASTITLSGHLRLYGKSQMGGNKSTYAVPTLAAISAGSPGVTTVTISWKTNVPASSQVIYGPTSSYGFSTSSAALIGAHAITIFGLTASSTYHYAVISTNSLGKTSTSSDKVFNTSSWGGIGFNSGSAGYNAFNFTFLSPADLTYLENNGVSTIRTMICWEEMQPILNESLNSTYLSNLETYMSEAAAANIKIIVDIHGYARYQSTGGVDGNNNLIGDPTHCLANSTGYLIGSAQVPVSAFANFWGQLSTALMNQPGLGGYELMNEPHDMGNLTIWPTAAEAAIGAIRAVDATTSIYVAGNNWQGALTWPAQDPSFPLNNPDDTNLIYTAHQYFDNAGGVYKNTYDQVSGYSMIGVDEYRPFVSWCVQYGVQCATTEFGAADNDPQWMLVMKNVMTYLKANNMLGMVHFYDSNQPGYGGTWTASRTSTPLGWLNAAPVSTVTGLLISTSTTPLMTLANQFDLGR